MKTSKILSTVFDSFLALLYILFAFTVSCMFEGMPFYSTEQSYLIYLLILWMPLCIVSIIRVIMMFVIKDGNRGIISLICLNAIYIPLIFGLGFIFELTEISLRVIGIIALLTMIGYFVLKIKNAKSKK